MLTGTFSVETNASTDDVRTYLADLRHQVDWRDDVISSELETGQAGEHGTIYRQHVHQGPGTSWRRIAARLGPGLDVGFETLGDGPVLANGTSTVRPSPDGRTVVQVTIDISFTGAGNLLQPFVRRELNRRLKTYPTALKHELDQLLPATLNHSDVPPVS